jgi:B12-binding domain/radical SAM domain protein
MQPTIIFFAAQQNKLSVCALLGAMETLPELSSWKVVRPKTPDIFFQELERCAADAYPLVAAFPFFSEQLGQVQGAIRKIRELYGNTVFCAAGGVHATALPKEMLESGFDAVVCGEGEKPFPELLLALANKTDWRNIPGLAFISENRLVLNPRPPLADLNRYPPVSFAHSVFGALEITRGCPNSCAFCRTPGHFGAAMRHRSVETICALAQRLAQRGLADFRAVTPNAFAYGSSDGRTMNLPAVETLLKELRKTLDPFDGKVFFGSFPSEVRPEHVTRESVALLKRYCHNDNLVIGAQTASPRLLAECMRGHTVDDFMNAAGLSLDHGFIPNMDFIFGLPGETEADAALSIACMEKLAAMGARIHAHTFMPLPGTLWAGRKAAPTLHFYTKTVNRLNGRGLLFGDWIRQRALSKRAKKI